MNNKMKDLMIKIRKALENENISEDKIKEVLDFLGYKDDGKFIPENGEKYWLITVSCFINFNIWRDDEYDNRVLLMSNVYRTEEEAEQALDLQTRKAKLIKEIEDSSEPIDWNDVNQNKHYFWLDGRYGSLRLLYNSYAQTQGAIYTTNREFIENLIKTRADEVKELLFGVK